MKFDAKFHAFLTLTDLIVEHFFKEGQQLTKEQADAIHEYSKKLAKDLTSGDFVFPENKIMLDK